MCSCNGPVLTAGLMLAHHWVAGGNLGSNPPWCQAPSLWAGTPLLVRVLVRGSFPPSSISFPFVLQGWQLGTNRQQGESPCTTVAHPLSSHSPEGVYHHSLSSLCSFLLCLPFFSIFLFAADPCNVACGLTLVGL